MGFLDKAKDLLAQNADTVGSQVQDAAKNALKDDKKEDQ
jgi:hypothetical protein